MNTNTSFTQRVSFVSLLTIQVILLFTEAEAQDRNCPIGSFFNGGRCKRCRPGTYQDTVGSTSCKKCPAGTFTSSRGVISKQLCQYCPEDLTSARGARECFKCPAGEVGRCGKCKRCPKGSYFNGCDCEKCPNRSITSEDNQSDCTYCSPEMHANKARTKCVDGRCPPGFQYHYGECTNCNSPIFTFTNFKNETTGLCQSCPRRTTILDFDAPAIKCEKCPPGQFLTDLIVSLGLQFKVCDPCPPGTTTVGFGKLICREIGKPCPKNTFEDEDGDCDFCDDGFRFDPENKRCVECKPNEVLRRHYGTTTRPSTECRKCAPGQIRDRVSGLCRCPGGEVFRDGRCRKCPAGTAGGYEGECDPCGPYKFSEEGASECTSCPTGTTSAGTNGRRCRRIRCPKGLIPPPQSGSRFGNDICVSPVTGCPRGLRGLGIKRGTFQCVDKEGNIACPKGYISNGKSGCVSCSEGWRIVEKASGRLVCRSCPRSMPVSSGGTTRTCRACENGFQPNLIRSKCFCPLGGDRFVAKNGKCRRCPSLPFFEMPLQCLFLH